MKLFLQIYFAVLLAIASWNLYERALLKHELAQTFPDAVEPWPQPATPTRENHTPPPQRLELPNTTISPPAPCEVIDAAGKRHTCSIPDRERSGRR